MINYNVSVRDSVIKLDVVGNACSPSFWGDWSKTIARIVELQASICHKARSYLKKKKHKKTKQNNSLHPKEIPLFVY